MVPSFENGMLPPGDIDCCYDPIGVEVSLLRPALLDLSTGTTHDGQRKGIIVMNLKELKP
jgi:hypothetical protein